MDVYLVRHCQATGQEPDAPLTPAGEERARHLAELLGERGIRRIISSPFARARASVAPLAERLGLAVEIDDRLVERVLCESPLVDWRERLRASFDDVDLRLDGGESSRAAMARGADALRDALAGAHPAVVVTHGNLLALLLRHLDGRSGFTAWERLTNPDVFSISVLADALRVERIWPEG